VFNFLVNACGAVMLFIYLMIAFAQLRLRKQFEAEAPDRLKVKMWFYPYGTWAAITGMAAVLILMGSSDKHAIELWTSVVVAMGFMLSYWTLKLTGTGGKK
jgi:GABA permease